MSLDPARFTRRGGEAAMKAVVTTGTGGYDTLSYRGVPLPRPADLRQRSARAPGT